jgi:epoxyqueuosine reductase QueG
MTGRSDRVAAARIFREEAEREGFSRVGIARALEPPGFVRFSDWIASGRHAGMRYLERTAGVRASPENLLAGARSVVCLAAPRDLFPRRRRRSRALTGCSRNAKRIAHRIGAMKGCRIA